LHFPFILLTITLAVGAAHAQNEPQSQANLVHFGDLIEVDVIGSFEYDWRGSLTPEGFFDGLDSLEYQVYGLCQSEEDLAFCLAVPSWRLARVCWWRLP